MSIWKLRASMLGTLAVIISLSTLFLTVVLLWTGLFDLLTLGALVVGLNVVQWLISPYIISALYRARELKAGEHPKLHQAVENLSEKSGIKEPKLMLADIPIPNAFAYGTPLSGPRVAVTTGLLKNLSDDEVEAVIGHELGHLKHRDVQVMMFVSLLPALFYFIGYSFMMSSMYGRQREGNSGGALLGVVFLAFWFILNLFTLYMSRLREYCADKHAASTVENGAEKLSFGLAKIVQSTSRMRQTKQEKQNLSAFKALFIADPDRAQADATALSNASYSVDRKLVEEIVSRNLTTADRIGEVFSTHPNIVKRLRALKQSA